LQSLSAMFTKINDDGVECEKVDVIRIKTVPKFMSVMYQLNLHYVRIIRPSVSRAL